MTRDDVIQSPFVSDLIRNKASRMRRRGGYSRSDQEDLQQELLLRLLEAWPRFDPRQGEEGAFAYTVINRAVAFVLRRRQRQLRADQAIRQVRSERLVREQACSDAGLSADLRNDVAGIRSRLPADLRDLAGRLLHDCQADVARELEIPHSTLQRRVRKLRTPFQKVR